MLEKSVRFKKNYSEKKNNERGCEGSKSNKSNNRNCGKGNPEFCRKKKMQEVTSCKPKSRDTKGNKKAIEAANPDREKDVLKVIRLDDERTLQEIIDVVHEFNAFFNENYLRRDHESNGASVSPEEIETKEKVLEKTAKNAFKH